MKAKIKSILRPYYRQLIYFLKGFRRIGLKTNQFTIISNNCTGGYVYQFFGIPYRSPTAGIGIHPDDYVKLIMNPHYYFTQPIDFLSDPKRARHYPQRKNAPNYGNYPVGTIGDIEIFFTHYHSKEEARSKWERRCSKICYEKLIFLFVENEWMTEKERQTFLSAQTKGKISICVTLILKFHQYPRQEKIMFPTFLLETG